MSFIYKTCITLESYCGGGAGKECPVCMSGKFHGIRNEQGLPAIGCGLVCMGELSGKLVAAQYVGHEGMDKPKLDVFGRRLAGCGEGRIE